MSSINLKTVLNQNPYMLTGYTRGSTIHQNLDLQRGALARAGCDKIFEEKKSGKAGTKRPEFEAALAYLRPEDVLVVWSRRPQPQWHQVSEPHRTLRQRNRLWSLCFADGRRHGRVFPRPQP
jgi:DNA invertase Pin-like site-specific DNA recombinase